ncbi:MAG: hypothetical protein NTU80_12745 [Verrucomicrobia bacterium]|nr:hypothetical protein [Verrucomicrobiota bacterium]
MVALTFAAGLSSSTALSQTLFNQAFNSSSTLADYINAATPSNGQFNAITSVANNTASISSGALVYAKNSSSSAGFSRTTDFSPTPSALLLQFDLSISGNSTEQSSSSEVVIQVGSGFSTSVGAESTSNVHSRIALNWTTTDGQWSIRRGGSAGASNVSANTTGTQTIRFYINNSGPTLNYLGIDNNNYSLINDAYDVWIGSSRAPNLTGVVATSGEVSLTDFKFTYASTAENAIITFDNLTITAIPEPASFVFITALATAASIAFRRQKPARLRTS